ncbi:zinc-dependent peptidase [Roseivirga sp. BDSF3-8]|uniref:zinc-dependent peptidase n=1 Tax=Roseivirga sp. BDSF3-8 TaxID=3241598 RepID=UPI00353251C5
MKFLLISAAVLFGAYKLYYSLRPRHTAPAVFPLKPEYKRILAESFPYYQKLPSRLKGKFERRVMSFILRKRFISRSKQIPVVTSEMKVLIAASAVQLTFGLPYVELIHFYKILIYSNDYYSHISRRYHKGETNPMHGIIVFSWNNFSHGLFPHDGINLGLHEMAHALRLENSIRNGEHNFLDSRALSHWEKLAAKKIAVIQQGDNRFLRDYGGVNQEEFFAVSVEAFFEVPDAFLSNLPELYHAMVKLLKQDPLNLENLYLK